MPFRLECRFEVTESRARLLDIHEVRTRNIVKHIRTMFKVREKIRSQLRRLLIVPNDVGTLEANFFQGVRYAVERRDLNSSCPSFRVPYVLANASDVCPKMFWLL